jgi:hypothetical protein
MQRSAVGPGDALTTGQARALTCPVCGATLWRTEHFWSCPRLHGKLVPNATMIDRLKQSGLNKVDAYVLLRRLRLAQKGASQ